MKSALYSNKALRLQRKLILMVILILTFSSVITLEAQSQMETRQTYRFRSGTIEFLLLPHLGLTLTSQCRSKKGGSFNCEAYQGLREAHFKKVKFPRSGGADMGALICEDQLHHEVLIGTDKKGNEISFCKFSDSSMISTGSLELYGRLNDDMN